MVFHSVSANVVAYNVIVLLLFVSHTRAVYSDPGIVPLPNHPIDFSDAHHDKNGKTENSKKDLAGALTNQSPPDEGKRSLYGSSVIYTPRPPH